MTPDENPIDHKKLHVLEENPIYRALVEIKKYPQREKKIEEVVVFLTE
jgi:hypothetical protein